MTVVLDADETRNVKDLRVAIEKLADAIERTYVRADVYLAHREADLRELRGVKALAMWALGLICGVVITALVAFVKGNSA